jgi:hypothetical protein
MGSVALRVRRAMAYLFYAGRLGGSGGKSGNSAWSKAAMQCGHCIVLCW